MPGVLPCGTLRIVTDCWGPLLNTLRFHGFAASRVDRTRATPETQTIWGKAKLLQPPRPAVLLQTSKEARKSLESSPVKTGFGETCYQEAERMRRKEPSPSLPRPRFYPPKGIPVGPCGTLIIATDLSIPASKRRLRHYSPSAQGFARSTSCASG